MFYMKRQCILLSLVVLTAGLFTMGCVTYDVGINVDPEFKDYVSVRVSKVNNPAELSSSLKEEGGTGEIRTIVIGNGKYLGFFLIPTFIVYGPRDPTLILFYESTVELTADEQTAKEKEFGITEFVRVTTKTDGNGLKHYYYYGRKAPNAVPETPAE
jgi:hypothetical protein